VPAYYLYEPATGQVRHQIPGATTVEEAKAQLSPSLHGNILETDEDIYQHAETLVARTASGWGDTPLDLLDWVTWSPEVAEWVVKPSPIDAQTYRELLSSPPPAA
jgi:hypothetical protein